MYEFFQLLGLLVVALILIVLLLEDIIKFAKKKNMIICNSTIRSASLLYGNKLYKIKFHYLSKELSLVNIE